MSSQNIVATSEELSETMAAAVTELASGELGINGARPPELNIEFLANLAHQLRSPISSLRVWVDLLADPSAIGRPEDIQKLVSGIDRATSRLERQISDVLEVGYLATGNLAIELGEVDATLQILNAIKDAEHVASSRRVGIDINLDDAGALVVADGERLKQVMSYLLSNAIRFSPVDGKIAVNVGPTSRIAGDPAATTIFEPEFQGAALYISVSNDGPGIAPSLHHDVFEAFHRAVRKDAHGGGGSGLGLTLVHGLVRLHRGGLWLRSDVDKGADFEFSLPQTS